MTVNLSLVGGAAAQFFTDSGAPLTGGKIYTYLAGSTTPTPTYTSSTGVTQHPNPIILDSAGRVPGGEIWVTDNLNYKFAIYTSTNVLIGTYDNLQTFQSNASNVVFDPAGTGAVATTVQAKLRESVSVKDFGAVGDGVTDDTNAIQKTINFGVSNGKDIFIPAGTYLVTSTLAPSGYVANLSIYGEGRNASIIKSQVIGASTLDIGNTYWTTLDNFCLKGNGLTGVNGNGHAIRMIDPAVSSGTYLPGQANITNLRIYDFLGSDTTYTGAALDACAIHGVNALGCYFDDISIATCKFGIYLYLAFQPKVNNCSFDGCTLSAVVDHTSENASYQHLDVVNSCTSATGGTVTLIGGTSVQAAGVIVYGSANTAITESKLKVNTYANISNISATGTTIDQNWIRTDGVYGIYSNCATNIVNNTFSPSGPLSVTRYDIYSNVASASTDIYFGEINGNTFTYGGGGTFTSTIEIVGPTSANYKTSGRISNNLFGTTSPYANLMTVTNVIKITGYTDQITIDSNELIVTTNLTVTNGWNLGSINASLPGVRLLGNTIRNYVFGTGTITNPVVLPGYPYQVAVSDNAGVGFRSRPYSKKVSDFGANTLTLAAPVALVKDQWKYLGVVDFLGGVVPSKCVALVTNNWDSGDAIYLVATVGAAVNGGSNQRYTINATTSTAAGITLPAGTVFTVAIIGIEDN